MRRYFCGIVVCAIAGFGGCGSSEPSATEDVGQEARVANGEPASVKSTLGPVSATVTVTPKQPLIGDVMSLVLSVDVQGDVAVIMPGKAEAFTRFTVEKYYDSRESIEGGERYIQTYQLQASKSGRLRIPPLRIAFVDNRKTGDKSGEEQELLTDEISIKVTPVLAGEAATDAKLRPIRGSLEERLGPSFWQRYWWALIAGIVGLGTLVGLFFVRRTIKVERISAYELASVALGNLESQGFPEPEELDEWYVQLSSIVREYLEGRFALRAPELTTQEFLRVAQQSVLLSAEHKALLSGFLADCDQVKFAGYIPDTEESRAVLEAARRFLLETREGSTQDETIDVAEDSQPRDQQEVG